MSSVASTSALLRRARRPPGAHDDGRPRPPSGRRSPARPPTAPPLPPDLDSILRTPVPTAHPGRVAANPASASSALVGPAQRQRRQRRAVAVRPRAGADSGDLTDFSARLAARLAEKQGEWNAEAKTRAVAEARASGLLADPPASAASAADLAAALARGRVLPVSACPDAGGLDAALASAPVVLLDLFTPQCAPCRKAWPRLEALAADYASRVPFFKLDVGSGPGKAWADARGARATPLYLVFRDGAVAEVAAGTDMDRVEAAIAAAGGGGRRG